MWSRCISTVSILADRLVFELIQQKLLEAGICPAGAERNIKQTLVDESDFIENWKQEIMTKGLITALHQYRFEKLVHKQDDLFEQADTLIGQNRVRKWLVDVIRHMQHQELDITKQHISRARSNSQGGRESNTG